MSLVTSTATKTEFLNGLLIFAGEVPFPGEDHLPCPVTADSAAALQPEVAVEAPSETGRSLGLGPTAAAGFEGGGRFHENGEETPRPWRDQFRWQHR